MYKVVFTKQALKDLENLKRSGISSKAKMLIDVMKENPYQIPPRYEKLVGDLEGLLSRRINIQHRLVLMKMQFVTTLKILFNIKVGNHMVIIKKR